MATTAPYTPPSMTKARSHLAVTIQHNHGTKAVNDARADIATVKIARTLTEAIANGTELGTERVDYLKALLAKAGE